MIPKDDSGVTSDNNLCMIPDGPVALVSKICTQTFVFLRDVSEPAFGPFRLGFGDTLISYEIYLGDS